MVDLKIIDIVKRAFKLVGRDPAVIALFLLPALFPIDRIASGYLTYFILSATLRQSAPLPLPPSGQSIPLLVAYLVPGFFLGVWASAAAVLKVTELGNRGKLGLIQALCRGLRKIPRLLVPALIGLPLSALMVSSLTTAVTYCSLLTTGESSEVVLPPVSSLVVQATGSACVLVVTLYVLIRLRLSAPACVTENNFGLRTSWKAVKGNWWNVLAIFLILGAVSAAVGQIPVAGTYLSELSGDLLGITAATIIYFQLTGPKSDRER
jgi:hypothetical protein